MSVHGSEHLLLEGLLPLLQGHLDVGEGVLQARDLVLQGLLLTLVVYLVLVKFFLKEKKNMGFRFFRADFR